MIRRTKARYATVVLAFMVVLSIVADDGFSPGKSKYLKWEKDIDKAADKARKKYKPILLYFYREDSEKFCKEAEEEYFKKPAIRTLASKFICIKSEASGKETEELRKSLKVDEGEGLILLLDCRFKEMERIDETDELEELKDRMKEVLKEHKKIEKKLKTVDKYVEYAENALKRRRMRDYVRALEALVALKKKLNIEDALRQRSVAPRPYLLVYKPYPNNRRKVGSKKGGWSAQKGASWGRTRCETPSYPLRLCLGHPMFILCVNIGATERTVSHSD